jgi:hypothetical protein
VGHRFTVLGVPPNAVGWSESGSVFAAPKWPSAIVNEAPPLLEWEYYAADHHGQLFSGLFMMRAVGSGVRCDFVWVLYPSPEWGRFSSLLPNVISSFAFTLLRGTSYQAYLGLWRTATPSRTVDPVL